MGERFATLVTCIDGRIQRPLDGWVRDLTGVDYVDTITEPGLDGYLATATDEDLAAFVAKILVSRRAHGSDTLVIAGHADCAGNPVPDQEHRRQLRGVLDRLAGLLPGVRVVAVHAARCGPDCWSPQPVSDLPETGPQAYATSVADSFSSS